MKAAAQPQKLGVAIIFAFRTDHFIGHVGGDQQEYDCQGESESGKLHAKICSVSRQPTPPTSTVRRSAMSNALAPRTSPLLDRRKLEAHRARVNALRANEAVIGK